VEDQHLEDLVDRAIEDEMLNQDQEFPKVMMEYQHQVLKNLKQQQEQVLLLVHEIAVE
jgi:aspartate aminotransferase-like enzyme